MRLDENALAKKKQQILEAAKTCFVQKGFHQTSTQDICIRAGMSTGNLYRYFDSKEAIIEAFAEQELHWLTTAIQDLLATDDRVQAIYDTVFWTATTLSQDGEAEMTAELFAEAGRNPRINAIYAKFNRRLSEEICKSLRQIEDSGAIAPGQDHKTIAKAFISLVDGLVMHKVVNPDFDLVKMRPAIETMAAALLGVKS